MSAPIDPTTVAPAAAAAAAATAAAAGSSSVSVAPPTEAPPAEQPQQAQQQSKGGRPVTFCCSSWEEWRGKHPDDVAKVVEQMSKEAAADVKHFGRKDSGLPSIKEWRKSAGVAVQRAAAASRKRKASDEPTAAEQR